MIMYIYIYIPEAAARRDGARVAELEALSPSRLTQVSGCNRQGSMTRTRRWTNIGLGLRAGIDRPLGRAMFRVVWIPSEQQCLTLTRDRSHLKKKSRPVESRDKQSSVGGHSCAHRSAHRFARLLALSYCSRWVDLRCCWLVSCSCARGTGLEYTRVQFHATSCKSCHDDVSASYRFTSRASLCPATQPRKLLSAPRCGAQRLVFTWVSPEHARAC